MSTTVVTVVALDDEAVTLEVQGAQVVLAVGDCVCLPTCCDEKLVDAAGSPFAVPQGSGGHRGDDV